jgi:hypothetical protein
MYEVEYVVDGVRVASFPHAGSEENARTIADDGIRRHQADHARIIHRITHVVQIWRRQPEGA